jgi:hypothetical protein
MHNLTPLGMTTHLKDLEREAMELRPVSTAADRRPSGVSTARAGLHLLLQHWRRATRGQQQLEWYGYSGD